MKINFDSEAPLFQQVADEIANAIISEAFLEGEQIPSVADLSVALKINPATALKGINILVDKQIVYKKRGLGMFVEDGAKEKLLEERRSNFYASYIVKLLEEGRRLGLSEQDIARMIVEGKHYE